MINIQTRMIIVGGCCLACLGGAVNAGFLIKFGTSVGHLTGDISRVAIDGVRQHEELSLAVLYLCAATFGFLVGATFAGYYICHPTLELSRPYGRTVIIIGIILFFAHLVFLSAGTLSIFLTSLACGLQNAMASHFRGLILRTTHMTGLITDLGSNLGMKMKKHDVPLWKIAIPFSLLLSYFIGSLFGAALVLLWKLPFLLILSGLYLAGGMVYVARKKQLIETFRSKKA